MSKSSDDIDWSLTSWEGSRREQIRRWSALTMDEILAAHEEMAAVAEELHVAQSGRVHEDEPPSEPAGCHKVTRMTRFNSDRTLGALVKKRPLGNGVFGGLTPAIYALGISALERARPH